MNSILKDKHGNLPGGVGHNLPPDPFNPKDIIDDLGSTYADLGDRVDSLEASCNNMPDAVGDEATAQKFTDQGAMVNAARKAAEGARKERKEPFLQGGRTVDAYFQALLSRLDIMKKAVAGPLTAYQVEKERQERERLEAERKATEEAAAKAAEAAKDDAGLDEAIDAETEAEAAAKDAKASAADLSRSRGQYGGVSSLRKLWTHQIIDKGAVDLDALRPHLNDEALDKAIRGFIKAGGRQLPGVKIYQEAKSLIK